MAVIWYLRKYKNGRYCALPHVIELMQVDYDSLVAVLMEEEEIKVLIIPFVSKQYPCVKKDKRKKLTTVKSLESKCNMPYIHIYMVFIV